MSFQDEIRRLLKDKIVIRHRNIDEKESRNSRCVVCLREIVDSPDRPCLALGDEGLICSICGKRYAPELTSILGEKQPEEMEKATAVEGHTSRLSGAELVDLAREIELLTDISTDLAKGVARGIIEAPAGHIGLMHYLKDIQRPPRKESESDRDYELRIRTYRMTRLYEKIHADTVGRIEKIKQYLKKIGLPSVQV